MPKTFPTLVSRARHVTLVTVMIRKCANWVWVKLVVYLPFGLLAEALTLNDLVTAGGVGSGTGV